MAKEENGNGDHDHHGSIEKRKKWNFTARFIISGIVFSIFFILVYVLFFLYAFFGGHVIDSVTSGTLFYFFLGKLSQNKKIRNA